MSPRKSQTDKETKISRQPVATRTEQRPLSPFVRVYQTAPTERVSIIRKGLFPKALIRTTTAVRLPNERIYRMLRLPVSTIERKLAQGKRFSPDQSERILGLQRLIGQVEVMVAVSGDPAQSFDTAAWVGRWLNAESPALDNQKPGDFLDTIAGQMMISDLLRRMQSGAYA